MSHSTTFDVYATQASSGIGRAYPAEEVHISAMILPIDIVFVCINLLGSVLLWIQLKIYSSYLKTQCLTLCFNFNPLFNSEVQKLYFSISLPSYYISHFYFPHPLAISQIYPTCMSRLAPRSLAPQNNLPLPPLLLPCLTRFRGYF